MVFRGLMNRVMVMSFCWYSLGRLDQQRKQVYLNENVGFNVKGYRKYTQRPFRVKWIKSMVSMLDQGKNKTSPWSLPGTPEKLRNGAMLR